MDLYESPKEVLVAANNRYDGRLWWTGRSDTRFGCRPFHLYYFLGGPLADPWCFSFLSRQRRGVD